MHITFKYLTLIAAVTGLAILAKDTQTVPDVQGSPASPIFGVTIPSGYRQWELIAPSHEAGSLDELRVLLGIL